MRLITPLVAGDNNKWSCLIIVVKRAESRFVEILHSHYSKCIISAGKVETVASTLTISATQSES
jgi:hypothetical protein